jgi:hypothetical protein
MHLNFDWSTSGGGDNLSVHPASKVLASLKNGENDIPSRDGEDNASLDNERLAKSFPQFDHA